MKYKDYLYQGLIFILLVSTFYFYILNNNKRDKIKEYETKLNKIESNSIIIDSIRYETVEEIWAKDIVISDTLITNERTLYLLKKYSN